MDTPKAVTAAAHKLASLIYTMLTKGKEYTDQGQTYYEERDRQRILRQVSQRASKLGMKLVVEPQPAKKNAFKFNHLRCVSQKGRKPRCNSVAGSRDSCPARA